MPQIDHSLLSQAKSFADEKRYAECADTFVKFFEGNPSEPKALQQLADVMLTLGQEDSALALLADSVDLQNPDGATLHRISNLLLGLGRDQEAADFLLCALYRDPSNAELLSEAGDLLKRVGRQAEFDEFVSDAADAASSDAPPVQQ